MKMLATSALAVPRWVTNSRKMSKKPLKIQNGLRLVNACGIYFDLCKIFSTLLLQSSEDKCSCYSCYNFLLLYSETKLTLDSQSFFFDHRIKNCKIRITKAEQDEALNCLEHNEPENFELLPTNATPEADSTPKSAAISKPKVQKKRKQTKISLKRGRQRKKGNEKFILKRLQLEDNETPLNLVDKFTAIKQRRSNFSSGDSLPVIKIEKTSDNSTVTQEEAAQEFKCKEVQKVKTQKTKQTTKNLSDQRKKQIKKKVKKAVWRPQPRLRMTRARKIRVQVKIEKSPSDINTTVSVEEILEETNEENQSEILTQINEDEIGGTNLIPSLEVEHFDSFETILASQESEKLIEEESEVNLEDQTAQNDEIDSEIYAKIAKISKINVEPTKTGTINRDTEKTGTTDQETKNSITIQENVKIFENAAEISQDSFKSAEFEITGNESSKSEKNLSKNPKISDKLSSDLSHIPLAAQFSDPLVESNSNLLRPRALSLPSANSHDFSAVFMSPEHTFAFFKDRYQLRECVISLEKISPNKLEKILSKRKVNSVQITKSGRIAKPSEVFDPSPEPKGAKTKKNLKTSAAELPKDDGRIEMEVMEDQATENFGANSPEKKKKSRKRKFADSPNTPKEIKKLKLTERFSKSDEKITKTRRSNESKLPNSSPKKKDKNTSNFSIKLEYPEDIPEPCEIEEGYVEYPQQDNGEK